MGESSRREAKDIRIQPNVKTLQRHCEAVKPFKKLNGWTNGQMKSAFVRF